MKFLIVTNHSYMLWQFRRELITKLLECGEVVLSMPFTGHEEDFTALGCRCIDTPLDRRTINPVTDLRLLATYQKLLRQEKPDMVITYSIKANIYGGYACAQQSVPYCVNVQGLGTAFQNPLLASIVTVMYRVAARRADTVFFENRDNAQEFVRRGIVPSGRIAVLRGAGVNLEYYPFRPYPEEDGCVRFLFLGRIMQEKGVDELFAAARRLKAEYGGRVALDLVGFFEEEYKETIDRLAADGILTFHGFQQDPRPFYQKAHCVVLPSYHEGMSNVLLEAAATGRALITSDIPGCREAVDDGINGFLCAPRSEDSLYRQMRRFVELTRPQREAMGAASRSKMEQSFDKEGVVQDTLDRVMVRWNEPAHP